MHFRKLHGGESVTLDDGTTVHSHQVTTSPDPSKLFFLIFLPNENYIKSFLSEETMGHFEKYKLENINQNEKIVEVMYHSVPLQCLINKSYKDFMIGFGP